MDRLKVIRNGAKAVRMSERPVADILNESGLEGLSALPDIGKSLASAISEFVHSGRLRALGFAGFP